MGKKLSSYWILLIIAFASVNSVAQTWISGPWSYRRLVTISNPGATVLTDYQFKITLDNNFDFVSAKSDGSDIRVTTNDGTTALPFWIEEWNPAQTRAIIWVKIPSIPVSGSTVFLYYGNNAATSISNGFNTFNFFDDFSSGSYVGSWGPGYVAHDWKNSSEMLNGVLECQYRNLIYSDINYETLLPEIENEFNYIHSQINQTNGQVISDPGGYLTTEPEYCYGLILANLANGYRHFSHLGNTLLADRCHDDMTLVFDYLSTTYPTVSRLNDAGGNGWLFYGFSKAWHYLDLTRASIAASIIQNYASTFINNQAIDGSWTGAVEVQEHLKRDIGFLWADEVTAIDSATRFGYRTSVKNNIEYILQTFWNDSNGGLETFSNPNSSNRFFENNQLLFMITVRRLNGRSGGTYNYTAQGFRALRFLTDYNWAGIDMYVYNYINNNTFFSYRDVQENGSFQNVDLWKGSNEIGTALWGLAVEYDSVKNYQSSHSSQPYDYVDMMIKQIKKSPSNGGFFSGSGNWIRQLDWTPPISWQPDVSFWSETGSPTTSTIQDNGNPVASFTGNGSHDNYVKTIQTFDNFILELKVKMTADANDNCTPEIGFRVTDNDNRYVTMLRGQNTNDLFISRYQSGVQTEQTPHPAFNYNANQYYKYKIVANNSNILQYLDDVLINNWNDAGSNITNGGITLTNYGGTTSNPVYFDDVRVRSYNAIEPVTSVDSEQVNPLPVELSTFSATIVGSSVKLNWRTETEVNNYGFEIFRTSTPLSMTAQDDKGWTNIGFVNGNGNSNSPKSYTFEDNSLTPGKYSYRLKQIDNDGQFEYSKIVEVDFNSAKEFALSQNYPNPFNPTTTIQFSLQSAGNVKLTLYNVIGQEVKILLNEYKESGTHIVNFDGSDLNSGMYIYKLEAGPFMQTRKMILMK